MDLSGTYIRARRTADDMTPPSQEAIDALSTPVVAVPPPGPANYGQPIDTTETSTITGKPKPKGPGSGEIMPAHENPEESAWDTMVKSVRSMPGLAKQAAGGALQAAGEMTYYGMEGDAPEAPAPGNVPALIEPGKELYGRGKKESDATLPNVPAGSFKAHLYGAVQSVGLNMAAIGTGLATGSPTVPLLLMGALSGGQDYAENRAAGVNRDDAWLGALANGAAEYFGEKLPLHAYLKEGSTLFRRAITGALLELPGELGTQIVQSAEEKLTRNPGMTWEEFLSTMKDTAIQTLMATTMTGGIFGAAGTLAGGVKNLGEKGSVGAEKAAPAAPAFDDETFAAEGKRLGVEYRGITALGERKAGLFQDEKTGSFAVQPGETVEEGLNRVRARFGLSPVLTPEKIMTAFPGAVVAQGEGEKGGTKVSLPNGVNITILSDQSIVLNPATGVTLEPGEVLAGEYTKKIGPEAIIRLAKEGMGDDTLLHESFHAAMDFALTPEEKAAVLAEHGGDVEVAAEAYAGWNPTFRNPLFQKIVDFFRKMREMLLGPTAEGTFERLRSGEAWQRTDEDPGAFFARLADRVRSQMPEQTHPEDVAAFMREEGVRPDEMILSGVVAKDGVVAKADVLSAIEEIRKETEGLPKFQIRRQANAPPFVSQLRNVVADEKMFPPSMKAPSVVNTLMKYGVKAAEIQDTGLAKFLSDKARVTREQLLDYIDMNMVRVEEKVRTDDAMGSRELLLTTKEGGDTVARVQFSEHVDKALNRTLLVEKVTGDLDRGGLRALNEIAKPESVRILVLDLFGRKLSSMMSVDQMDGGVLAALKYEQVQRAVIASLPVEVVDSLRSKQLSAEQIFSDPNVLVQNLSPDHLRLVADGILSGARSVGASLRAELLNARKTGTDADLLPTLKASDLDARVIVGLLSPESLYHVGLSSFPGDLDVAGTRTVDPLSRRKVLEGFSARWTDLLDTPISAFDGTETSGGSVTGSDLEGNTTRLADYLNWHNNIVAQAGASRQGSSVVASDIPSMPIDKTWANAIKKLALRYAAEQGYDSITWTNGDQQQITTKVAAEVLTKGQPLYQKKKSGRYPGEPNDKGYTFNSNDAEEVKNAGRALLLNVWPDVEFTQSNEETAKRAQAMLDEGIVNIERIMARGQNDAFASPELMVAADRLRHGVNKRLVDTARQWKQGDGTVSDEEMRKAIALSAGLTQVLQGGISQTGRVLQARQIAFEGQEPGSKEWTDAVSGTLESIRNLQGAEGMPLDSIVTKIMAVPEPTTFLPKLVKITNKDMFIEAWYGALLSNPVTHAANFIGNTVALFSSIPERGLASLAHRITGKGEGVAPGEAFAALYGAVAGFQDALRFAAHTAWTGESKFMGDRMERRVREPAITGANLGASGPIGAAVDLLGMAIRGPGRALLSSDEFFKAVNYRMEVYAQAYREAYSEGLTGDDLKNRMAEMVQNPPEQIQETAAEWANYQTFTNALGPLGSAIVKLSNAHPAMKVVLPFVATPTNILKYTFERLGPLSLALKSVREDISAGGSRRDLAIARVSLGSMVMGTAAYLAAAGFITGGGPKDKDLLAAKRRQGWQPYSFLVGDKYYSFSRLEPYATLFGMTADIVEMAGERSDLEIDAMAKAMVLSFARNMTNKTYLTGVSDALEAITDPDKGGGRFVHRFVGSWVPAGVAQMERVMDPATRDTYGPTSRGEPNALLREAKSMLREMRSRTPGLSSDLPPRLNLWGDPILLGGGLGPDIISPIYTSIEKASPADDEILRNRVSISMPPRFLYGSRPSDDVQMRDESVRTGIPLTPKEYDFLVRVAAGQKVTIDGKEYRVAETTLKEDLEEMIKSPEYKAATDGPDGAKALMIRARVTAYRDAAKAMLLDASPELAQLYEEKIEQRAEALVGAN